MENFQDAYRIQHTFRSNFQNHLYAFSSLKTLRNAWIPSFVVTDEMLIASSYLGELMVYNFKTKNWTLSQKAHAKLVNSLIQSNKQLISGSADHAIKVWDLDAMTCKATLVGHSDAVTALCYASDGKLFSGSSDKQIRVWDISANTCTSTLLGHNSPVSFLLADQKSLFSGSNDGTIHVWNLKSGICKAILEKHTGQISSMIVVDDLLISASHDKTINIWDLNQDPPIHKTSLLGHAGKVTCLVYANEHLISGAEDQKIKIWNLKTNQCTATYEQNSWVTALAFSNGKLFSTGNDNIIRVWDFTASNKTIFEEIAHLFERGDDRSVLQAQEKFSQMPQSAKDKIYGELYLILKPQLNNDYWGCAEHAFHGNNRQSSSCNQKARAIRNYLQRQ